MRVDFYETGTRNQDPLEVVCVLVGKAWPANRSIAVVGPRQRLAELDEQLWHKPQGRFVPHELNGTTAPVRLVESAPEAADLLINLDPRAPLPEGRYGRVLEIVPPDESARKLLRKRWLAWKERGADLHHHQLK